MSGPVFLVCFWAALAITQTALIVFQGQEFYRFLFLAFDVAMLAGFYGSYQRTIARRQQKRVELFEEWLRQPIPELEPETDWAEIERAIGGLMSMQVDPTYERARDFLRNEEREREFRHQPTCAAQHLERILGELLATEEAREARHKKRF